MGTCTVQCAVDDTSCLVLSLSYDSPYQPHQGQCLLPAVAQQHPHVPGLLHHGEPSPLTECSHVYVCIFVCVGRKKRRRRGELNEKGKGCATDEEGWQRLFSRWDISFDTLVGNIHIASVVTIILASYPGSWWVGNTSTINELHFPKKSLHVVWVTHCTGRVSANTCIKHCTTIHCTR